MKYKADLHIHTVLSPCGDLEMSPLAIIRTAKENALDIIAITDHNSTKNALLTEKIGQEQGVFVLCGAEVTTSEEVHCVCLMPNAEKLTEFQKFIESKILFFQNDVNKFGYQLVLDEEENIVEEIPYLLINAINSGVNELQKKVYELEGIFIPAHVDRATFSLSSQLGFVPNDLDFDILELSKYAEKNEFLEKFPWFQAYSYIKSSDAHFLHDIAAVYTELEMKNISFENIKKELNHLKNLKRNK